MGLSIERNDSGYEASLIRRDSVYDFIDTAMFATGSADRLRAVVALGKSGDPRAVRPLIDLLGDANPEIRLAVTMALGQLKSGRPVDSLLLRLRDRDEKMAVREQAAASLSVIRSTGAVRGLREFAAEQNEEPSLRLYTENLLKGITRW
jgi:HEAT repeat protein